MTKIKINSTKVLPGDTFIPIIGETHNGHTFIPDAIENGASVVYYSQPGDFLDDYPGVKFTKVEDTTVVLGEIAKNHLEKLRENGDLQVVAITGSVGKTTTKDLLGQLLAKFGKTVFPQNSFNNEIGLPLTILEADETTKFLVLEMGANHIGEIANLTNICRPDVAVLLKVGVAHSGEFGGADVILKEKVQIFSHHPRVAIYFDDLPLNASPAYDDAITKSVRIRKDNAKNLVTDADLHISFEFEGVNFSPSISGEHNVYNVMAVIETARALLPKTSLTEIAEALEGLAPIAPHRMSISHYENMTIIDDAYNANPDSMKAALNALQEISAKHDAESIAILGDMYELGADTEVAHAEVAKFALKTAAIDKLVVTGKYADFYTKGIPGEKWQTLDDYLLDVKSSSAVEKNVVYLLKGSSSGRLWEVAERLKEVSGATR